MRIQQNYKVNVVVCSESSTILISGARKQDWLYRERGLRSECCGLQQLLDHLDQRCAEAQGQAGSTAGTSSPAQRPFAAMSTTGVLKTMFAEKGFGFVTPDDGGDDCFVHVANNPELDGVDKGGASVSFDKEWDDRKGKYKGVNCRVTGGGGGGGGGGKGYGKGTGDRYSAC